MVLVCPPAGNGLGDILTRVMFRHASAVAWSLGHGNHPFGDHHTLRRVRREEECAFVAMALALRTYTLNGASRPTHLNCWLYFDYGLY